MPYASVDPYNPSKELIKSMMNMEHESENSASVIIDIYRKELEQINEELLNEVEKDVLKKLMNLCGFLEDMKVVDGKVLLKFFEIYKFKPY